ncbi:NADPH:quinone reductase-like Zn-dependent oxidoreductase [Paenibacillus forsythiae]|uniref:NADPH:quinone reductase-like Zn-dependent oxidoreductase n=1 Tax=Paenibacillus forsythiae TaxID=365616 RepID=A0ABU3H501_9BACL|nr:NADP-dependent oxidoreductase [Paenibacillus forsythiae]MDT3425894.1 NADPH:quinone reductase-like Zn-dependent oxidoreductase [Paenibacillus forsythiae]
METGSTKFMKAIRIHTIGGPEVLTYEDVPRPSAESGEVLVRIHAAGINPADWRGRAGYLELPEELRPKIPRPSIPGSDISGIVEAVGPGVDEFSVGDAVYGLVRFPPYTEKGGGKGYAEYTTAPVTDLALKPATIDHIQAAAVPMAALTAWQLLFDHANLQSGQTVLVNGAAGGVGHFMVQFAKLKGARVIGVASGRHETFLRELGVDQFIDYTSNSVEEVIRDVDLLLDNVGGPNGYRLLDIIKRGGTLIPVNIGNYPPERLAELDVTRKDRQVRSNGAQLSEIGRLIDAGQVRIAIDSVFSLAEASKAHEHGEKGHLQGKIVLRVVD